MAHTYRAPLIAVLAAIMAIGVGNTAGQATVAAECKDWRKGDFYIAARPPDIVRCLEAGADPNAILRMNGRVPVLQWVTAVHFRETPNAAATRALLKAGAAPNGRGTFYRTSLHRAVSDRWLGWRYDRKRDLATTIAVVTALMDAGADPNALTQDPRADQRHGRRPSVIQTLRQRGAPFFVLVTRQGWSPLMLAVRQNESPEIVKLLLDGGGDPDLGTKHENWTSLHIAAWRGNPDVIRLLLENGGDARAVTAERRWTPLHILAQRVRNLEDALEAGELLLNAGIDPGARDAKGRTAWDFLRNRFSADQMASWPAEGRALAEQLRKAAIRG